MADNSKVDNYRTEIKEDCCICYEKEIVSPANKLICKHAVCAPCTKQLRKAQCPICRANIEGGYYTEDVAAAINSASIEDANTIELIDLLYADYINQHRDRRDIQSDARSLAEAFGIFISSNPNISSADAIRIFRAFVSFYEKENAIRNNYTPNDAINEFSLIGLTMLDNPNDNFNQLYQLFFRQNH